MIILLDTEKLFDKIKYNSIYNLKKRLEGNLINLIVTYQKKNNNPIANTSLKDKTGKGKFLMSGTGSEYLIILLLSNIFLGDKHVRPEKINN